MLKLMDKNKAACQKARVLAVFLLHVHSSCKIFFTQLNTELISLRIPRELVIIYLCKPDFVFISICSSRPFPFTARKCFQKARLDPEGVLFLGGGGALKAECLNRALEAASGGGESMRGDRTPGFF